MLKYTYIHDPLFGPPASWLQPETSIGGIVTVQRLLLVQVG